MRPQSAQDFPIVCVGGSAGGLDAYTRLLSHLPDNLGVAVVIVNHLRVVGTLLHEILPHYTRMPVELITDRLIIQPNRVFIIPSQRDLHVRDGEFRLEPISKPRGWPDVITVFLQSLTQYWDGKLVAVRQVLTQDNFARVQPGMGMDEVRRLLPQPGMTTRAT